MRQPHAAADDAVVPDLRLSAQNRGAGIDDDAIADIRMPLDPFDERPVLPDLKALGAERDVLIQLDAAADGRRLPDHHAGRSAAAA